MGPTTGQRVPGARKKVELPMAPEKTTKSKPRPAARKKVAADTGQAMGQATGQDAPVTLTEKPAGFRLKDLIERVVAETGAKRNAVKPVVEATLKALGQAFDAGDHLTLPPLGRARVNRSKDTAGGAMLTIKLRRGGAGKGQADPADDPLAAAEE